MARSLIDQQTQIRGTTSFSSVQMEYAEQAGRSYYTGTLTAVSGSNQVTDDSTAFTREDVNNYIVIDSGAAAGVYLITDFSGNTATVSSAINGDITGGSYRRHYFRNLEDDLNYVREQLKNIVGETNWYDIPDNDLYQLGVDLAAVSGTLSSHNHDDLYSPLGHTHTELDITDLDKYTQSEVNNLLTAQDEFIELLDTPASYVANSILVTTSSGIVQDSNLTYDPTTETFATNNATIGGTLGLSTGTTVNEIITTVDSGATDDQLATAKAVYDLVDLEVSSQNIWEVVDTPTNQIRPKIAYQGLPIYTAGDLTIGGNLTISGTTTTVHSQELTVADKVVTINYGEVGSGVTGDPIVGIQVDRGTQENYLFAFDEVNDNFRVGVSGSLQAVATREDSPTSNYIAYWNDTEKRFDTALGIDIDSVASITYVTTVSGYLQSQINDINTDISNLDYYTTSQVDNLLASRNEFIELLDTPSAYIDNKLLVATTSGLEFANGLTFDGTTFTVNSALSVTGAFGFDTGATVNEITTEVTSGSTSDQLVTANAVWEAISTSVSGAIAYGHVSDGTNTADAASGDNTLYFYGTNGISAIVDTNNSVTFSGSGAAAVYSADLTYNSGSGYWYYDGNFTGVPDGMEVFLNGVKNKDNDVDYYTATVSDGELRIDFSFPTDATDWVNVTYGQVFVAQKWISITSSVPVGVGQKVLLDSTGGAYTLTLPASPVMGDEIEFLDAGYYCTTNNVTLDGNGNNIMGSATNMVIDSNGAAFKLVYYNSNRGWVMT